MTTTELQPNTKPGLQAPPTKPEETTTSKWDQPEPTTNALEAFIKSRRESATSSKTTNRSGGGYAEYVQEQRRKAEQKKK